MSYIGVDGCKAGWLAIRFIPDTKPEIKLFPRIDLLWQTWGSNCKSLLIDMPIGLSDSQASRECDRYARQLLGGAKAASIFNPPLRAALKSKSWQEAAQINENISGKRISLQSWGIVHKIKELDHFMINNPDLQTIIREAHPELLFTLLNKGSAPRFSKKNSQGIAERLHILKNYYNDSEALAIRGFKKFPRKQVQRDDIVDALVLAITAFNFKDGLRSLPQHPLHDSKGLRMEIVIPNLQSYLHDTL